MYKTENSSCTAFDWYQFGGFRESEVSAPVTTGFGRLRGGTMLITDAYAINSQGGADAIPTEGVTETITAATNSSGNNRLAVAYGICSYESNNRKEGDVMNDVQYRVRRLTPL